MSNIRETLGRWTAVIIYYGFIFPIEWVPYAIKKAFYCRQLNKAKRKAVELNMEDGRKRFIVPVGGKLHVMDRNQLKSIVNQYRRKHGGQFVSWQRFYIASVG